MSYLTQSVEELQRAVISGLAGKGFTFAPTTETFTEFLARALGHPTGYLRKSAAQLLAELNSDLGGSTVSHLSLSYAELLDTVDTTLAGSGGGGDEGDEDMTIARVAVSSAEILALHDTPKVLISAPGVGKAIRFIEGIYFLQFGTTPYTIVGAGVYFEIATVTASASIIDISSEINDSQWIRAPNFFGLVPDSYENAPLILKDASDNPIDGDGTLLIDIFYRIVDLP